MSDNENQHRYGREKLYQALNTLTTGPGSIQERLESGAIGWTGLSASFPELLPANLMPEMRAIMDQLTRVQGPEGAIRATTQAMSDREGAEIAERILSLYINVRGGI